MSETVLKLENISKQYRLGEVGTGTLSHDLKRWWYKKRGKEDPFLKIGEENRRDVSGGDYVWAIRDINLEVKKGEVLGIIGRNGAGKSTLLKLLSRVTAPTTGRIKAKGRIASLLEVGTGMHPDLTGRENIYLNGAILGMTKAEIASKFDEIVAFSGCAKYVDTPVKRYSSGMKVRLGFAVAAFLEPEILIVDEVLAVGDAEFQKKAIGKMQDVAKGGGRTVLFVSHNMAAVKSLCSRALLLENGKLTDSGNVDKMVSIYLQGNSGAKNYKDFPPGQIGNEAITITHISVLAKTKEKDDALSITDELIVKIKCTKKIVSEYFHITLHLKDEGGNYLFGTASSHQTNIEMSEPGEYSLTCTLPADFFNTGTFYVDLLAVENRKNIIFRETDLITFTLVDKEMEMGRWLGKSKGPLKPLLNWSQELNLKR